MWDVWQQYRDEQELQDSLDEMHEMMDEQDEKNYVDENGYSYRYIYQPGETTDYRTDSLVGLSADEVYDEEKPVMVWLIMRVSPVMSWRLIFTECGGRWHFI